MAFRCDFHLNGGHRRLILTQGREEPFDHVALRLACFALFWGLDPQMEISPKHPALASVEYRPDFIALTEGGEVALWGECGNTSLNKLDKLTRRFPSARLAALRATPAEGRKMRQDLEEAADRHHRVEVFAFREGEFAPWRDAVGEVTQVFGESSERSLNLVINDVPVAVDLLSF